MTISDRDLIATVHNRYGDQTISRFDYTNDEIGRRTSITRSGAAFSSLSGSIDHYGYNDRSEVIGAQRFYGSDITDFSRPVTGRTFGYGYDPIGNRTSSTEWDENGVAHTSHYTANELNEYESRTVPGHVTVLGEAATDATVTVNGNPAWRKGAYFAGGDSFDNTSSDVFAELATTAVRSTGETESGLSITLDCFYFAGEFATTCFSGYEYYKSIRLTIRQLGPIKKVPELYVNESGFLRQIEYLEGGGFIRDYLGGMIYHTFGELRDVITVGEDFYDLITIDGVSTPIDDQGSSTNNQPNPEPEF